MTAVTGLARERLEALLAQLVELHALLAEGQDDQVQNQDQRQNQAREQHLRSRMRGVFEGEIGKLREQIEWDIWLIQNGAVARGTWVLLEERARECRQLFSECLCYLQSLTARFGGTAAELCRIADAMLDQLNHACELGWRRFTAPSEGESYSEGTQIIRLRFPLSGIWDIPIAAHEFGHFAAYRLNAPDESGAPFPVFRAFVEGYLREHLVSGEGNIKMWRSYLNEYFADIFATYVLGPSYACTALLLRFEPANAERESSTTHPSFAKRARAIVETLQRMDMERENDGKFSGMIDVIKERWRDALLSAGTTGDLPDGDRQQVSGIASDIYGHLKRAWGNARYSGWGEALSLFRSWKNNQHRGLTERPTIADLLNAAWLARLNAPLGKLPAISKEMISLV